MNKLLLIFSFSLLHGVLSDQGKEMHRATRGKCRIGTAVYTLC